MSDATHASRQRLQLWLRAERAFGLRSVSAAGLATPAPVEDEADRSSAAPAAGGEPSSKGGVVTGGLFAAESETPAPDLAAARNAGLAMPLPEAPAPAAPELAPDEKRARLIALDNNEVRGCTKCRLCETRTNTVFGVGDPDARLMFIGEGPGANEDLKGEPFVGRAGELLNKWIAAMGLRREHVFIANIVKCRPPENREPAPDEVATCTPYLVRQIEIIRPRAIVTLGRPAMQYLLQSKNSMSRMRGTWHAWRGVKVMPTYHPAYVLRSYTYENRAAVWDDLKKVMTELGLPLPQRPPNAGG